MVNAEIELELELEINARLPSQVALAGNVETLV